MKTPIIVAAFGTTSRSRAVYETVHVHLKRRFAGHPIQWAFTSRFVRARLQGADLPSPGEAVRRLADQGHRWAVVQSFHMICGHEFHRLVQEVQHPACRVSMGHSLLCRPEDHRAVAEALAPVFALDESEAVVLVGHGTDHCSWSAYPAFGFRLREMYGPRAFVGVIEGGWPDREALVGRIVESGFRRARLVPFLLVAGVHFREDLAGSEDSWKTVLEARGVRVALETEALGSRPSILDIFAQHMGQALEAIPDTETRQSLSHPGRVQVP
ncbi:MAG: sirohydrochlorin cobaltochelatase [Desulfacinum sp.]|jgi:sirohydrochlorin cobaltochelatase|nr:sirohydrochlorin cobaltochelatase [Desulfacinum sp.]MBZ4658090.1 anaerobic cobalt chelatase [Desulfacinum sp.]